MAHTFSWKLKKSKIEKYWSFSLIKLIWLKKLTVDFLLSLSQLTAFNMKNDFFRNKLDLVPYMGILFS